MGFSFQFFILMLRLLTPGVFMQLNVVQFSNYFFNPEFLFAFWRIIDNVSYYFIIH